MKYYFILSFLLFSFISLNAQKSTYIENKGYEGYIFPKSHFILLSIENQKERYTPTIENIEEAEYILKDSIDVEMGKYLPSPYLLNGQPRITNKILHKYKRQYFGFLTNDGDIVIYINLLRDGSISKDDLGSDIVWVLDGGSNYWQICVNITKCKLFGLSINGIA